jgi:IS30 family transposase
MHESYSADSIVAGLAEGLDRIPVYLRKSITFDEGTEWAKWREIADGYYLAVWCANTTVPWENAWIESFNVACARGT